MNSKTISILGCGWLGLPLAKLLAKKNWSVRGSVTKKDKLHLLKTNNIQPYIVDLNNSLTLIDSSFFESEYLLINIPPTKLNDPINLLNKLAKTVQHSPVKRIVFISSTSAYNHLSSEVIEEDTKTDPDNINPIVNQERLFQKLHKDVIVLRLAGLIGPNRHPGRFFANGRPLSNPESPVNLIHLDDCLHLIITILEKGRWGEIYNGCADTHPSRIDFYTKATELFGQNPLSVNHSSLDHQTKIVNNQKIKNELGYKFIHPDLLKLLIPENFLNK